MYYTDNILQDEIHLWSIELDVLESVPKDLSILSSGEIERSKRFVFERDRNRFITGRSGLRIILSKYTGIPAECILFTYNKYGKPSIDGNIEFNCSHSDNLMVVACTAGRQIGVDIEKIKKLDNKESLAHFVFTSEELEYLYKQDSSLKDSAFFRLWTRKEALLKAAGVGIGKDLLKVNVTGVLDSASSPERYQTVEYKEILWKMKGIDGLNTGFCGTICYEGDNCIAVKIQELETLLP